MVWSTHASRLALCVIHVFVCPACALEDVGANSLQRQGVMRRHAGETMMEVYARSQPAPSENSSVAQVQQGSGSGSGSGQAQAAHEEHEHHYYHHQHEVVPADDTQATSFSSGENTSSVVADNASAASNTNANVDLEVTVDLCGPDATCDQWITHRSCAAVWEMECPGVDHEEGNNAITVAEGCPDECSQAGYVANTVEDSGDCHDNATFVDAQGTSCSAWADRECSQGADHTALMLSADQLLLLQQHCRQSCEMCETGIGDEGHAADEPTTVAFSFLVSNIDFSSLNANTTVKGAFVDGVKEAIAVEAGSDILATNIAVELSAGSVNVNIVITAPMGVHPHDISQVLTYSSTLSNTLQTTINNFVNISAVSTNGMGFALTMWSTGQEPNAPTVGNHPAVVPATVAPHVQQEDEEDEAEGDDEEDDEATATGQDANLTTLQNSSSLKAVTDFEEGQEMTHEQTAASHPPLLHPDALFQRVSCTLLALPDTPAVGEPPGGGKHAHKPRECIACAEGCTPENQQRAVLTSWTFVPPLEDDPMFDVAMRFTWVSVEALQLEEEYGLRHKAVFEIAPTEEDDKPFQGNFGAEIEGGGQLGDALTGRHFLEIHDSSDLLRALPGRRQRGDLGSCKRACLGCREALIEANYTTGTRCEFPQGMSNGQPMIYRFRHARDNTFGTPVPMTYLEHEHVEGQRGAEWTLTMQDNESDIFFVGRIVLEAMTAGNGMTKFTNEHSHSTCVPCDAFFESAEAAGPFILHPYNTTVAAASVEPRHIDGVENTCHLRRTAALDNLRVRYESGPGTHIMADQATDHLGERPTNLYTCP